eukprot:TRINITY_DN9463_c0_g1_i1.p1 TRINITY_DN9463_c0_g1~~TRINITY_DN9463_c0_g1_i1.p1  ORF type:complete len:719 (+),score=190.86 TRINITY_DN9463_c0_g1_i1:358-2514(+)
MCALERISADLVRVVDVRIADADEGFFEIAPNGDAGVTVTADTPVSVLSGVRLWLRDHLSSSVSWTGSRVQVPSPLPPPPPVIHRRRVFKYAYYGNVCTPSYTMWNWGWDRWERELDWMALNGINLPLVITGQEWVWMKMYSQMGLSRPELDAFFAGPAFLAWHRMGNLRSWGGPLTDGWLEGQRLLTRRIIARATSLGMMPVLPGFHGHVPRALSRLFPSAELGRAPLWFAFKDGHSAQAFVEPTDPLYVALGTNFSRLQREEYGTSHWYAVDQFNELEPRSRDHKYLARAGRAQWEALVTDDPDAHWIVQGWQFLHKGWPADDIGAYLSAVPYDRLLVLDLMAEVAPLWERTHAFAGRQYVWSIMHSFGGTIGLSGDLNSVMRAPYTALRHSAYGKHCVGIGLTMEGTGQNTVLYDLVIDHVWEDRPRDVDQWVRRWAQARYGSLPNEAALAWAAIRHVYRRWPGWGTPKSVIVLRPSIHHALDNAGRPSYDLCDVVEAWRLMAAAGTAHPSLMAVETFVHDLVEVAQAVIAEKFRLVYAELRRGVKGFTPGHTGGGGFVRAHVDELRTLLTDFDWVLSFSPHFLFGTWMRRARALASDAEDERILEFNARNQVTLWGPRGEWNDYAAKHWAGLVSTYYARRWQILFDALLNASEDGSYGTAEGKFWSVCSGFEQSWQRLRGTAGLTEQRRNTADLLRYYDTARSQWLSDASCTQR